MITDSESDGLFSAGQSRLSDRASLTVCQRCVSDGRITEWGLTAIIIPALSTPTSNLMGLSEEAEVWSPAIFQIITLHNRDVIVSNSGPPKTRWSTRWSTRCSTRCSTVNTAQNYIYYMYSGLVVVQFILWRRTNLPELVWNLKVTFSRTKKRISVMSETPRRRTQRKPTT